MRFVPALITAASLLACSVASGRDFQLARDTFAFSNDTVFAYGVDEAGLLKIRFREKPADFSHRCFVLSEAVLQFRKYARFAPEQPRVTREEYGRLIRQIRGIPLWCRGPQAPIVVPGYRDLGSFSEAYEGLFKENLGHWLPSYLRVGNWRMLMGHPRAGQAAAAQWLRDSLAQGQLRAVYLARFPHMNHVVVVYGVHPKPNGDLRFAVYDPNSPRTAHWLDYRQDQRSFDFEKRWYFPGGRVNVMRLFLSPFH